MCEMFSKLQYMLFIGELNQINHSMNISLISAHPGPTSTVYLYT